MIWSAVRRTWFAGMAKPSPMLPLEPGTCAMAEAIPTTWPAMLTCGPPEFPGLIAVSVWFALLIAVLILSPAATGLFRDETMPVVTGPLHFQEEIMYTFRY